MLHDRIMALRCLRELARKVDFAFRTVPVRTITSINAPNSECPERLSQKITMDSSQGSWQTAMSKLSGTN